MLSIVQDSTILKLRSNLVTGSFTELAFTFSGVRVSVGFRRFGFVNDLAIETGYHVGTSSAHKKTFEGLYQRVAYSASY